MIRNGPRTFGVCPNLTPEVDDLRIGERTEQGQAVTEALFRPEGEGIVIGVENVADIVQVNVAQLLGGAPSPVHWSVGVSVERVADESPPGQVRGRTAGVTGRQQDIPGQLMLNIQKPLAGIHLGQEFRVDPDDGTSR